MKRILLIISTIMLGTVYITAQVQTDCRREIDELRQEIKVLTKRVNQLELQNSPNSFKANLYPPATALLVHEKPIKSS